MKFACSDANKLTVINRRPLALWEREGAGEFFAIRNGGLRFGYKRLCVEGRGLGSTETFGPWFRMGLDLLFVFDLGVVCGSCGFVHQC